MYIDQDIVFRLLWQRTRTLTLSRFWENGGTFVLQFYNKIYYIRELILFRCVVRMEFQMKIGCSSESQFRAIE